MSLITQMLAKSSIDFPHKKAFINKQKYFTFSEIDDASTKVANFLLSKGVGYGDRIGVFSTKNLEEIIVIFAAMKLGCIFIHINPFFKTDQLSYIISDCDVKALFIHESKARVFNKLELNKYNLNLIISLSSKSNLEYRGNLYYLDNILRNTSSSKILCPKITDNDPAAIIYTSGSTGKPKGIIVTHKIFYDSTVISAEVFSNNSNDRLISITPFSFDGALSQLFTMIYSGGTLVLQESYFPKDVVNTMHNEKITGFHAVPSFWRMLLEKHSPFANYEYPYLRYISIIGEVFPHNDLMRLRAVLNKTNFFMMYGITEAFRSTYLAPEDFEEKTPSVGKPFPGVEIIIENNKGGLCGSGEIGEIVHKGAFISPGYWNNPVKTREVFKKDALYTGDLGKIDDEGYLYFVGRKDTMIKSMGYRISPEEIEECLGKIAGVEEAAVQGVSDQVRGNSIHAVIVCSKGSSLSQQDISNFCKMHLPYYAIPNIIEFRNEIPKTGTFKIDRTQIC